MLKSYLEFEFDHQDKENVCPDNLVAVFGLTPPSKKHRPSLSSDIDMKLVNLQEVRAKLYTNFKKFKKRTHLFLILELGQVQDFRRDIAKRHANVDDKLVMRNFDLKETSPSDVSRYRIFRLNLLKFVSIFDISFEPLFLKMIQLLFDIKLQNYVHFVRQIFQKLY